MTSEYTLRIESGDRQGETVPVSGSLVVGRGDGADLRFPGDRGVSPRHARFSEAEGRLWIEDLGSVNGVFLRVTGPVLLLNRDRLRFGDHVFSFEIIPEGEAERTNVTRVFSDPTTEVIGTTGAPARARLVTHLSSGRRGKEYSIGGRAIEIGRGKGTHNFMSDKGISPRHARIAPEPDGGFVLTDLGSAGGTWRQTRERIEVEPGQELLIGRHRLTVLRT